MNECTECWPEFIEFGCNNSSESRSLERITSFFISRVPEMKIDLVTRSQCISQFHWLPSGKLRNKFEIISFMEEKVCCDAIMFVRLKSKTRRNIVCATTMIDETDWVVAKLKWFTWEKRFSKLQIHRFADYNCLRIQNFVSVGRVVRWQQCHFSAVHIVPLISRGRWSQRQTKKIAQ